MLVISSAAEQLAAVQGGLNGFSFLWISRCKKFLLSVCLEQSVRILTEKCVLKC
jgi:hypothetical protein